MYFISVSRLFISGARLLPVAPTTVSSKLIRYAAFTSTSKKYFSSSGFDVFNKLKDPLPSDSSTDMKRKPSEKVLNLVDQILTLTLIEAADLCDLCQERLSERSNSLVNSVPGRAPFPHPMSMFADMVGFPHTHAPQGHAPSVAATPANAETPAEPKETTPAKKDIVSIKLVSFDRAKKVAVVKEVKGITALGLKESKDMVEEAPKTIQKGVPIEKANEIKQRLEAAGAEVILE